MRSTTIIVAVSLGLALAACGKKTDTTTTTETNMTADANMTATSDGNAMGGTTVKALGSQQFTDLMVGSDKFEIESGKLAETMGSTAAIKAFGKQLVTDHTKSAAMFKTAAGKTTPTVSLPILLPADLKANLAALKATKGADFDKLFVQQQTEGHQKALDALKAYAAGGDQQSLKDFANAATPVVTGHLDALKKMAM